MQDNQGTRQLSAPVETATLSEVEPRDCVTRAAIRATQSPGAVTLPSELT
jgi:hypothetical protein